MSGRRNRKHLNPPAFGGEELVLLVVRPLSRIQVVQQHIGVIGVALPGQPITVVQSPVPNGILRDGSCK